MTTDRTHLDSIVRSKGYTDFNWFNPAEIVVSQWVRMKCMYGCSDYGRNASCPPNVPSVAECRAFFSEYTLGIVFHFSRQLAKAEDRHAWTQQVNRTLLGLEREIFLAGYQKTFLLFMDNCKLCEECAESRASCRNQKRARPAPEALGMDVFATVTRFGYPIQVLSDYTQEMNRYAFLLVE